MSALVSRTVCLPKLARRMTWADIEADRAARSLPIVVHADPRLQSNLATHVETPRARPGYTAAQAAKARRMSALACPCRLCALAVNPPATISEWERLGLSAIGAESSGVWEVRKTAPAVLAQHEEDRAIERLVSQGMTTAEAFKALREGRG